MTVEKVPLADSPRKRAVLYLRVSTVSQVNTDYNPEGISIPAQREACLHKAEQLGIDVVGEYIEPGRSGTSMEKREAFQQMLARIRADRDVEHVLIYKLSRMNRNRIEDGMTVLQLRESGVSLVSATENIDETPVGQLMHGILASINEFRSAEDGADIRYKMGQKAKNGGTLGRAPIGYRNVRIEFEGRQINSVEVDPERAALITRAFELYATGDYNIDELRRLLGAQGLSTRPTARHQGETLSVSKVRAMLESPYYAGMVVYKGETFTGRHPALIDHATFERVQEVIQSRSKPGQRDRILFHYLKGLLFCDRCHKTGRTSRLIYTEATGRGGRRYDYYICRGRQLKVCDLPHIRATRIESAIPAHYATRVVAKSGAGR